MKAFLLLLLLLYVQAATIGDVGFDFKYPTIQYDNPQHETPVDTRSIAPRGVREAQLSCFEESHVNRVVLCDIVTWDVCGNIDDTFVAGNVTNWLVEVRHAHTGRVLKLVSPVVWHKRGSSRFYFTPTEVGAHRVTVTRKFSSHLAPLTTSAVMTQLVLVHNTVASCSNKMSEIHSILRTSLWTYSSWLNERNKQYAATNPSQSTKIVLDSADVFGGSQRYLQQNLRRPSIQPDEFHTVGSLPGEDLHPLCDVVQQQ